MIKNAVNILAGVTQTPKLFAPGFLFFDKKGCKSYYPLSESSSGSSHI